MLTRGDHIHLVESGRLERPSRWVGAAAVTGSCAHFWIVRHGKCAKDGVDESGTRVSSSGSRRRGGLTRPLRGRVNWQKGFLEWIGFCQRWSWFILLRS